VPLAIGALAVFSGCSGHTTGASDITLQPDGTYSAKLNVVGSCDKGSPSTPCTAYTQWRKVGTSAWTKGPTVTVPKKVKDVHRSQTATGLAPNTTYEYQVCGKEFGDQTVKCVGPNVPGSTDKFATGGGSTAGGNTTTRSGAKEPGATKPQTKKGQHTTSPPGSGSGTQAVASQPTNGVSHASSDDGGGGGTSPLVPIAIGVGTAGAVIGGTWLAGRRFLW
jgi:hypothetical protein